MTGFMDQFKTRRAMALLVTFAVTAVVAGFLVLSGASAPAGDRASERGAPFPFTVADPEDSIPRERVLPALLPEIRFEAYRIGPQSEACDEDKERRQPVIL